MLPLTINNIGPEFTVESLAPMFGHPGISALEYAGTYQELTRKTLSLKGKSTAPSHDGNRSSATSTAASEGETSASVVQELSCQQRRRGTFINHTPRTYEMRSPKRTEFPRNSGEASSTPHTSTYNSFRESGSPSAYYQNSQPQIADPTGEVTSGADNTFPVELDSKEVRLNADVECESHAHRARIQSITSSRASKPATRPLLSIQTSVESRKTARNTSTNDSRKTEKRQRRQTPFKVPVVIPIAHSSSIGRYSPLEPLVARHRREASIQSLGDSPPQVEIDSIAEVSTFRAIQEYFDNQASTQSTATDGQQHTLTPPRLPSASTLEPLPALSSTAERPASTEMNYKARIEGLETSGEPTPEIPTRSPNRPHPLAGLLVHTPSNSTVNSDFESAAHGEYSPYDKKHNKSQNSIVLPKRPGPSYVPVGQAARAGSSNLGRMAPPILGHATLTATTDLNDLNHYLRNTGPPPESHLPQQRKKSGFKMFKVGGKKSLVARVGSVEGSPKAQRARPASTRTKWAREMTTSGGAKHLQIMIDSASLAADQTVTLPVSGSGSDRRSRHVRISFTEEMLYPLASPELESVISGSKDPNNEMPTSPLRSPRTSPTVARRVPVDDHPLLSREEITRKRKLRDLQRARQRSVDSKIEHGDDTVAGAETSVIQAHPPPALQRPGSLMESLDESDLEESEIDKKQMDSAAYKMALLQEKVIFLQHQNAELADALAKIVGLEVKDGDAEMDAETVLEAYRQMRDGSEQRYRRGRVFASG
ncbi:hypothetical protein K491DRAFT_658120 [Lophiostoma macrostomum CBS 122681]|uniref:Uncharacterized protein n=1 Tax=Lophiostoma macrostomum CBS 122681 TaxID=1314788 RepID=A0A6A6T6J9_9PLEO|nr:hypothetical protein K491DRAFT_658120 [Lophiostoma macrostomum CBS 122681]